MKRYNTLDLFMTHKHEMDVHYGLQVFRPLHNFINLFINHNSGCPYINKEKDLNQEKEMTLTREVICILSQLID